MEQTFRVPEPGRGDGIPHAWAPAEGETLAGGVLS